VNLSIFIQLIAHRKYLSVNENSNSNADKMSGEKRGDTKVDEVIKLQRQINHLQGMISIYKIIARSKTSDSLDKKLNEDDLQIPFLTLPEDASVSSPISSDSINTSGGSSFSSSSLSSLGGLSYSASNDQANLQVDSDDSSILSKKTSITETRHLDTAINFESEKRFAKPTSNLIRRDSEKTTSESEIDKFFQPVTSEKGIFLRDFNQVNQQAKKKEKENLLDSYEEETLKFHRARRTSQGESFRKSKDNELTMFDSEGNDSGKNSPSHERRKESFRDKFQKAVSLSSVGYN